MHFQKINIIIKERRESLRNTQETLADLSGIGLRTIKQIESGKGNPTLNTLQQLADILGMELSLKVKKMTEENEGSNRST